MQISFLSLLLLLLSGCKPDNKNVDTKPVIEFGQPARVEIKGYAGNIMEPFLSRDGNMLLFNNLNSAPENTNLHWATKINDTSFQYNGEIAGINTTDLEGVPTLDNAGHLYFVSTRNYANTLSTLYQCDFANGVANNVRLLNGLSKLEAGWVNFDVEASADGQWLYFVDAQFDQTGSPKTADLILAQKNGTGFQRSPNSNAVLKNINTGDLEYAACISPDNLELYFTRVATPLGTGSMPEILFSKRKNTTDAFGIPSKIESITGFVEAPTIVPDQKALYYHKKEGDKFVLYMIHKK